MLMAEQASADWLSWLPWVEPDAAQAEQVIVVAEPYLTMRSGAGAAFPIIHSVERGERLTLLKRKTNWFRVRDAQGREGWSHLDEIRLSKQLNGEQLAIRVPRFDDYKTRRWEGGLMMGEYDKSAVNAAYVSYWMTENLAAELWGAQVLDDKEEIQSLSVNITHQAFPHWRYSPFFSLGLGQAFIDPKERFVEPKNTTETMMNVGLGMRLYVTDRYFVRAEIKDYKLFTEEKSNEEATEWKLGLSVFF